MNLKLLVIIGLMNVSPDECKGGKTKRVNMWSA